MNHADNPPQTEFETATRRYRRVGWLVWQRQGRISPLNHLEYQPDSQCLLDPTFLADLLVEQQ
ncbi:MAG: hypothetical protein KAU35_03225, partial [candidate division Zixibacteria bacterium]|nr:hypothetical protein [candidate division Zixibacteria bacterium]